MYETNQLSNVDVVASSSDQADVSDGLGEMTQHYWQHAGTWDQSLTMNV